MTTLPREIDDLGTFGDDSVTPGRDNRPTPHDERAAIDRRSGRSG